MNKAMSKVFIVAVVLFVALVVNLTWIMVVRAQWFQDRPENKRSIAKEMKIKRGDILGYDGSVIAGTERRSGYYYRDYPNGTLAPQLVGYDSVRYGRSGIEAAAQRRAHRPGQRPRRAELGGQAARAPAQGRRRQAHPRAGGPEGRAAELQGKKGADRGARPQDRRAHRLGLRADLRPGQPRGPAGRALSKDPAAPLLNRPTQGLYVPGSAFKVVTASAGLDTGKVTPDTQFVDTGTYVVFGGKVTNYGGEVYGPNNFTDGAHRCPSTRRSPRWATCSGASGSSPARSSTASTRRRRWRCRPARSWPAAATARRACCSPDAFMDPLDVAWAACGQEKLLATPLQMALVAGGVANGGRVMKPYYLQEIVTPDGAGREQGAAGAVARGDQGADRDASSTR